MKKCRTRRANSLNGFVVGSIQQRWIISCSLKYKERKSDSCDGGRIFFVSGNLGFCLGLKNLFKIVKNRFDKDMQIFIIKYIYYYFLL
jgi:UDP-2,3-diacylglucosamine pyrophosphatase LpxH